MAQSPADREAQEIADVERIARAFYEVDDADIRANFEIMGDALPAPPWDDLEDDLRDHVRRVVRSLLGDEIIQVGKRPVISGPIAGQLDLDGVEAPLGTSPFGA